MAAGVQTALVLVLVLAAFVLSITAVIPSVEAGNSICCDKYAPKPIQRKFLKTFHHTPTVCRLPAVIFVTIKGLHMCTNPNENWVKAAMKKLGKEQQDTRTTPKYR
ncbi:C-C motif chemokine 22 [Lissotriton helveticus]